MKKKRDRVVQGSRSNPTIKTVVGAKVYAVWLEMLRRLVPYGRTHRLSVLIASMLQVAVEIANEKEQSSAKARELVEAIDLVYEDEDGEREILRMIEELFKDAGVKFKRVSSRGERYSIAEDALYQFIHWEDMPWER